MPELQLCYARDFLWEGERHLVFFTSADILEHAPPMPLPPPCSSFPMHFLKTLDGNPQLFKIISPINMAKLKYLLLDHPNQPFVKSVLQLMREGAWPWAHTPPSSFWPFNDQSQDILLLSHYPAKMKFFFDKCKKE